LAHLTIAEVMLPITMNTLAARVNVVSTSFGGLIRLVVSLIGQCWSECCEHNVFWEKRPIVSLIGKRYCIDRISLGCVHITYYIKVLEPCI
jgi:hypothetical protein